MNKALWTWKDIPDINPEEPIWANSDIPPHLNDEAANNLFAPVQNINSDDQDIFSLLKKVIQHMHSLVKKVKTDNTYIEKHMGKLSARNILARGKTSYMNPCLDFVLVTIEWLKRAWIEDIQFVIDELEWTWWPHKIHFGIELIHKGTPYYVDYRFKNNVFIGKGNFDSSYQEKWENVVNKIKVDAKNISIDDNMYALVDKWLVQFKFFDINVLDMLKQKLQQNNTDEQRTQWFVNQVRDIHQADIAIEDKNSLVKIQEIQLDTSKNMLNLSLESLLQPTEQGKTKKFVGKKKSEIKWVLNNLKIFMDDYYDI